MPNRLLSWLRKLDGWADPQPDLQELKRVYLWKTMAQMVSGRVSCNGLVRYRIWSMDGVWYADFICHRVRCDSFHGASRVIWQCIDMEPVAVLAKEKYGKATRK